jgi:hypothetical protein
MPRPGSRRALQYARSLSRGFAISTDYDTLTAAAGAEMFDFRSPIFGFSFLVLVTAATLFPPYHWGEDKLRLGTEVERRHAARELGELYGQIPIKRHAFLFGDSHQEFLGWGWQNGQSVRIPVKLHRRVITAELVLQYVLAVVIAALVTQITTLIQRGAILRRTSSASRFKAVDR